MKAFEIVVVFFMDAVYELFGGDPLVFCANHYRCAVSVVGAEVKALIAAYFLKPHPDIGLEIFDEMADVDGAVCVGQGGGNDDFTRHNFPFLRLVGRQFNRLGFHRYCCLL